MISEYELKIKGFENDSNNDEFEEITVEDFLNRECLTKEEKLNFIHQYNAINIHYMISTETYDGAFEVLNDKMNDSRLSEMNAIVFLSLKPKGRAKDKYTSLSQEKFDALLNYALDNHIACGMDSCSAQKFLTTIRGTENYDKYSNFVEPCESTRMSSYFNTHGKFFPCSFIEGQITDTGDWTEGLDGVNTKDFMKDIWNNSKTNAFRNKCIECNNTGVSCPHYTI
jgi:hypothetical protein